MSRLATTLCAFVLAIGLSFAATEALASTDDCVFYSSDGVVWYGMEEIYESGVWYYTGNMVVCSDNRWLCTIWPEYLDQATDSVEIHDNTSEGNWIMIPWSTEDCGVNVWNRPRRVAGWDSAWLTQMYIYGYEGTDIIFGSPNTDYLYGGAGNDLLGGGESIDLLYGDDPDCADYGACGDDRLYGNDGLDLMAGFGGLDYLDGGDGNDICNGGDGADSCPSGDCCISCTLNYDCAYE